MPRFQLFAILFFFLLHSTIWAEDNKSTDEKIQNETPLDRSLKPEEATTEEINAFFKDVIVIQRRAKDKSRHYLFYLYETLDFSDGPTTYYGTNFNLGYAFTNSFELYFSLTPIFVANDRDIVQRVEEFTLVDGKRATIEYSKPKSQIALEAIWAPAYGKDSWGPYNIIRSDTFFKLGVGAIQYEKDTGMRFNFSLGKSFFIDSWFNPRFSAGGSYLEAVIDNQKKFFLLGVLEFGLIWYI